MWIENYGLIGQGKYALKPISVKISANRMQMELKNMPDKSPAPVKKDKQKVIGEQFDKRKLALFLELKPYDEKRSEDFHILLKAYRGLPVEGFEVFIKLFVESGRGLDAKNHDGVTFVEYISQNESQQAYVDCLRMAIKKMS